MSEPQVRVLLVSGMPDTRLLQEKLNAISSGLLQIITLDCLDKALKRLGSDLFDAILLDLSLPARHGAEVVHVISRRHAVIPIIWLCQSDHDLPEMEIVFKHAPNVAVEIRDNPHAIWRAIRQAMLRERLEKTLREDEERFRIACEASRAMVYDIDARTGRARFVHGLQRLLGYGPDESLDKNWWFSQIHHEDILAVHQRLKEARSRGTDYSIQYRVRHNGGYYILVEDSGRSVFDQDRRTVRAIGRIVDITRRIQSSDTLLRNEKRYHALADKLELLVEERTADLRKLNRTLEMVTGCAKAIVRATSEEDLLSNVCSTIVDPGGYEVAWIGFTQHDAAKTVQPVARAVQVGSCLQCMRGTLREGDLSTPASQTIRKGKASAPCGCESIPAGQSPCGLRSSITLPLRNEAGPFGALVICSSIGPSFDEIQTQVLQDLADDLAFGITALRIRTQLDTALQNLEQRSAELRDLATELTQAEERERKRLAQAIHDDLQQLLVASKFCAETLACNVQQPALRESAQQLNQFLGEAIESARSLSFELSPPVLHSAGLAKALHYLARRMEMKHGLIVNVATDEKAEPKSEELRVLLFQSTRELLFNVVKHASVRIADVEMCRLKGGFVQIRVSDSGAGFDPEKGSSENSQNGFGLYSIRGRLGLIGGDLEIKSTPGAGSCCTITAPLSRTFSGRSVWKYAHTRQGSGLIRAGRRSRTGNRHKVK